MSEIAEIIDSLENKIEKLFFKLKETQKINQNLLAELQNSETIILTQKEELATLKEQYKTLKMANSLLGSNENKRDTKLKINSLIREIDYCIAQLSD